MLRAENTDTYTDSDCREFTREEVAKFNKLRRSMLRDFSALTVILGAAKVIIGGKALAHKVRLSAKTPSGRRGM